MSFFHLLKEKFSSRAASLVTSLDRILTGRSVISPELLEELEELLIGSDLGVSTATDLVEVIKAEASQETLSDSLAIRRKLWERLATEATAWEQGLSEEEVVVDLFVGLNGSGKTTTVAKISQYWKDQQRQPFLICADTFRAAAAEQLCLWGKKVQVPVFTQQAGADPGAVVYDGLNKAIKSGYRCVLIDTAGRMQTKIPLMEQLKKISRVISKVRGRGPTDTILVMDATVGQSGLPAAKKFKESVAISSLIMTKLDGTAKGGVIYPIAKDLQIPISFIGMGEEVQDLYLFQAQAYFAALLGLEVQELKDA